MGEFKVHRVRFFDYMPSAISAMAFNVHTERLAVARADGTVEIYNFADNCFQEKVIPGKDGRTVEALCWAGQRLFSTGLNGEIVEYDLVNLRSKYTVEAYGGPVWTISSNSQGTQLAVGCEDGTVKIFELVEDSIQFLRNFDRLKSRVLSLSWHPSGTQIAAGTMDMIRVFNVTTGHATQRMMVDRAAGANKKKEVAVWSVVFLSDNTVISGDSAGKVQVWDSQMGTLIRTHLVTKWDVMALAVSRDESSLLAGTSEGSVVQFQFISAHLDQPDKEWQRTRTLRSHSHDVRALVHTDTAAVSGGNDAHLVVRPFMEKVVKGSKESAPCKITFPHRSLVSCGKKAGILLFQFPERLEVWRLGESNENGIPGEELSVTKKPEALIHLKRKGDDHICCSTLSPCGGWLAYASASSVRLFQLQYDNDSIALTKVKLPKVLRWANQLCFSADSSRLFASFSQSSVLVFALSKSEAKYVHTLKPKSVSKQAVHLMSTSDDGQWLATANSDCEVHVYNLKKLKYHCTVPVYGSCPSAMAIHPTGSNVVMVHADQKIFEYSLEQKEYTEWSRSLAKKGLHGSWLNRVAPVTHVSFSASNPDYIILHDMNMFCIIDKSLPLPEKDSDLCNQNQLRSMNEAARVKDSHAFKICEMFKNLLCVGLMEDHSLVVVERPLLDIATRLPAPVRQKKFAT
ncbi:U3 small nucleolar RNA-associated protein 4 homolog [Gadus macrocephalus]|uniref:U3 small nucleolar RNA-associated protein 4 homolog n=1 Tax=Gadus macrocephalus TaxID=80720 RepID=UPI0028CB558E|nr:U3 small nucleolar RNA-associated protein 4 homolog [Gadus macrocephalus]XP_059917135.1 U3 small nucleolar RNA-associated protein 4 homolog [Gadus macrocephalus]